MLRAIADVGATHAFVVVPGGERFPVAKHVEAVPLPAFVTEVLPALVS